MGKRSNFPRISNDYYRTWDPRAVAPLLAHVPPGTLFEEPCAGAGDLMDQLEAAGLLCLAASDMDPQRDGIAQRDALEITATRADMFITNPPWSRGILHALIRHLSAIAPTWLLFDADWMHTQQSAALMPLCRAIVSVGRVRWEPGTDHDGKDNCAWYRFETVTPSRQRPDQTLFFPRCV